MARLLVAFVLIAALAVAASALSPLPQRHVVAERSSKFANARWQMVGEAPISGAVNFRVLLKQQNLDKLEAAFWAVSDPRSEQWGQFLSREEIATMVGARPEATKAVLQWLREEGVTKAASLVAVAADYIEVHDCPLALAARLFQTRFATFALRRDSAHQLVRAVETVSVPQALREHIDFVVGISELIGDTKYRVQSWSDDARGPYTPEEDELVTPSVIQKWYNVPAGGVDDRSYLQGIAAFTDFFSLGALGAFDANQNIDKSKVNVTRSGPDCLTQNPPCDQYESDLDVQYITALALGAPTVFLNHGDGQWILEWAQQVNALEQPPLVNSISYGWAELEQCEITSDCSSYGYSSQQYVARTNTELQKLGLRGLTVFVSDGDDGAPSLGGASGNCPLDPSIYCPTGGCAHEQSSCNEITIEDTSTASQCYFPMGIGSDSCGTILNMTGINDALNAFAQANSACQLAFEYDRTQLPHVYSSCACSQLKKITKSGISVYQYNFEPDQGALFAADFPTSSPFVTSVGATQFQWRNNVITSEEGASILDGAKITTGGGFSSFQGQPGYQQAAVAEWLSSAAGTGLPPAYSFNTSMRGYPDITLVGHNFLIYASNNTNEDQCPCVSLPVDGTSCSSPSLAGLISLLNAKLVAQGESPLGFLNPMLYQLADSTPQAFNDISEGDNRCNRAYCCLYGFGAQNGWDPVSGLGSPNFANFEVAVMQLKARHAEMRRTRA